MLLKYSRIIISGQSGIRPDDISIPEYYSMMLPESFIVIKMEDYIKPHFNKKFGSFSDDTLWLSDFLKQAPSTIEELWKMAILDIANEIKKKKVKNFALILHAVFYNHRTLEFFSPVCERLLKKIKPQIAVTLIDDIYDIHQRLSSNNHIFNVSNGGAKEVDGQILELINILDWRSREIMMTRHISNELEIRHYVVAVKHNKVIINNLLSNKFQSCYLSHPITAIRQHQSDGNYEHANKLIMEVHDVEEALQCETSGFFPTTIDEYRIKKGKLGKKIVFENKLNSRWDEKKYEEPKDLLYNKPQKYQNSKSPFKGKIKSEEAISTLLAILDSLIKYQIDTRDHIMVEQCDALFVYRPFCEGIVSKGVLEEVLYYQGLENKKDKKCLIYYNKNDLDELVIDQFHKYFESQVNLSNLRKIKKVSLKLNNIEKNELAKIWKSKNKFATFINKYMQSKNLAFSPSTSPLSGGIGSKQADEYRQKTAREIKTNISDILKKYKETASILVTKETSIEDLVRKFKEKQEES